MQLATMTVRFRASKRGAAGQINVADFDEKLHARLDEPVASAPQVTASAAAPVATGPQGSVAPQAPAAEPAASKGGKKK